MSDASQLPSLSCTAGLVEAFETLQKGVAENTLACGLCEDAANNVEAFCRECRHFLCSTCTVVHKKLKADHKTVVLTETESEEGSGDADTAGRQLSTKLPIFTCEKHSGKILKRYCFDCKKLICPDCNTSTSSEHVHHKTSLIENVASAGRNAMHSDLSTLKKKWGNVSSTIGQVKRVKDKVKSQKARNSETIARSFEQLYTILEGHKSTLIQHANAMSERKMSALREQEERLVVVQATLRSIVQLVEWEVTTSSDEVFVSRQPQMSARMEELTDKYESVELGLAETANVAIRVTPRQKLEELCRSHCEIYHSVIDPKKTVVRGERMEVAMTNQTSQLSIQTFDDRNQPCASHQRVSADITPLRDGSTVYATVIAQTPSKYDLSYVPTVRGHHEMTIRVNGVPVQVLSIFVRHHPSLMGRPTSVQCGVDSYRIAINAKGETLTSDFWRDEVAKFDQQQRKIQTIEIQKPSGVATDTAGNIYIATTTQRLVKYSPDGVLLKALGKEEKRKKAKNDSQRPAGICCHNTTLLVCDQSTHCIQVYDLNLKQIRMFGSRGPGDAHGQLENPQDVATDSRGNVYVADAGRHQVVVFSEAGQYVTHLGGRGVGRGELGEPRGVCVIDEFVYVAENGNSRISVFDMSGRFVTLFGRPGSGEGEMKSPWGVAADRDGFLCVCDPNNHRIQVF